MRLHSLVMGAKDGQHIDHINRDRLDNRKKNLRFATQQQNTCNSSIRKDNTSGVTGIRYREDRGKWTACINYKGVTYRLGHFSRKEDAVIARKEAEVRFFGEFAPGVAA